MEASMSIRRSRRAIPTFAKRLRTSSIRKFGKTAHALPRPEQKWKRPGCARMRRRTGTAQIAAGVRHPDPARKQRAQGMRRMRMNWPTSSRREPPRSASEESTCRWHPAGVGYQTATKSHAQPHPVPGGAVFFPNTANARIRDRSHGCHHPPALIRRSGTRRP